MTRFELLRLCADPLLPPLAWRVRKDLRALVREFPRRPRILDIGARRSPYTIGLPARVTLLDVPRSDGLQEAYDLGLEGRTLARLRGRRSNVEEIRVEDFLENNLEDGGFDIAVAVEVIEHVEDDATFLRQLARVLRPGGVAYLTTPNGDTIPVPSPQHVRHYTRRQLAALCAGPFESVEVRYGLRINRLHRIGHRKVELRRPLRSIATMCANAAYRLSPGGEDEVASGTAHLVAVLRRPRPPRAPAPAEGSP